MAALLEKQRRGEWRSSRGPTQFDATRVGTRRPVEVDIEELVLHGFAPGDRHRIADAVERELARLMGEAGAPGFRTNRLALERIDGGAFRIKAGLKAQTTGTHIAQAVYRSLRQQTKISTGSPAIRPGGQNR